MSLSMHLPPSLSLFPFVEYWWFYAIVVGFVFGVLAGNGCAGFRAAKCTAKCSYKFGEGGVGVHG